ncbi:MAG: hypothetical protein ACJA0H_001628 [Francisellaceae bacterium]|jgi:hypothetical protein
MRANSIKWYFNRLKAMEPSEILDRVIFTVRKKKWSYSRPKIKEKPNLSNVRFNDSFIEALSPILEVEKDGIIKEADQYLDHYWLFFDLNKKESDINWHFDPQYEKIAPSIFTFSINHRLESLVGNIKNTWEKNRHHHLTIMASAYYLTKDEKYALEVKHQLISWVDQNRFLQGVNWSHPLEHGVRLISWVYIYHFLKTSAYHEELFGSDGVLWQSILEHQKFIEWTYSKGSSANNHLIGEMAGLFIASNVWPVFSQSSSWSRLSESILERELVRQTYADGVNRELAFSYQYFVLEFSLLSLFFNRGNFSEEFKKILVRKKFFIDQMKHILLHDPNYGDGDEGMALQVVPIMHDRMGWIKSMFDFLKLAEDKISKDFFLSKEAGLAAIKWHLEDERVMRLFFDFGPLGMGTMAAHGHADSLNITLTFNEEPILIDPGTYCYHDNLKFRSYFRSTLAHNTIALAGLDQSKQIGPFLWSDHAMGTLEAFNFKDKMYEIIASHNGYLGAFKIIHRRRLVTTINGLKIEDILEGEGEHLVTLSFHFYPNVKVSRKEDIFLLESGKSILRLEPEENLTFKIVKGNDTAGWYSKHFGTKAATCTLVMSQMLSLPAKIITKIVKD